MACRTTLLAILCLLLGLISAVTGRVESCIRSCGVRYAREGLLMRCSNTSRFNSSSFNKDILFGTATSAHQIEGATRRGPNVWDTFTHFFPEKTYDQATADIATDSYNHYERDVKLLVNMGLKAYRFSISWSRLLPRGRGKVNQDGINYYHNLLNLLQQNNIEPFVTLFHWDLPQALHDEYGGFLSRRVMDDFKEYADLCFKEYGDIVKHWITFNQPYTVSVKGYGSGTNAPGRCSAWMNANCTEGDSGTEPYLVAHHQILAHAAAVQLYRDRYQKSQKGLIGATLIFRWFLPYNPRHALDVKAAERALDFFSGWFIEPMMTGEYPQIMIDLVNERLPRFSQEESNLVKQSLDFVGVNYYISQYVRHVPTEPDLARPSVLTDARVNFTFARGKKQIGPWGYHLRYRPAGIRDILEYLKDKYNNPLVFITENGLRSSSAMPLRNITDDFYRIQYHCSHLCFLRCAIKNGSNVGGYFVWSLVDNYEFGEGYSVRFGMNYVNFKNVSDRRTKSSATWYSNFVKGNTSESKNLNTLVDEL